MKEKLLEKILDLLEMVRRLPDESKKKRDKDASVNEGKDRQD
jgi:hypothetical protein